MTFSGTTSGLAIAAAAGLFAGGLALTPASAADLGSDCCADLEERVAELEATTVRKGNRKVSVKLSGEVNRAVMWWDDGDEENVYVVDSGYGYSSTRFRFTGDANWKPGWKIGFALEWQQTDESSANVTATDDDTGRNFTVRQAHWWVKSDKLGKLTVGQLSTASDSVSEVNLSGATVFSGSQIGAANNAFRLVNNQNQLSPTGRRSALTWANIRPGNLDGLGRQDGVRYDSPTFAGFTISTGWYEDDAWDVALRFAKQWNSVLFAAAIGYAEDREGILNFCEDFPGGGVSTQNGANDGGTDCSQLSGSVSILHQPTGLFATFAAGQGDDDGRRTFATRNNISTSVAIDDEAEFWYGNLGINRRFNEHGKTSVGVEYYMGECGFAGCGENGLDIAGDAIAPAGVNNVFVSGTEVEAWGVWLVQNIDNAATEFYIAFHHFEADVDLIDLAGNQLVTNPIEDMETLTAGARIKF